MLILLVIMLLFFIIVVFLLVPERNEASQEINESYEILTELTYLIQQKENELNELPSNNVINRFTNTQNKVLDVYENSNIRLPYDILEDLAAQNLKTEKEIFDFIENQRNYWKLENQKKPYKKTTY